MKKDTKRKAARLAQRVNNFISELDPFSYDYGTESTRSLILDIAHGRADYCTIWLKDMGGDGYETESPEDLACDIEDLEYEATHMFC